MASSHLRPADPDVKMPDAVRRAALLSEKYYQSDQEDGQNTEHGAGENTEASGQEAQGQQEVTDQTDTRPGNGTETSDDNTKVANQAEHKNQQRQERARARAQARDAANQERAEQAQPEQRTEPSERPHEDWERQYTRMKGRFDHANNQLQQMSQQIAGLQNVIATMQAPQAPQAQEASPQQVQQVESMLTPEEREQYGDEFLSVVAKKANEIVGPLKRELEDKIRQIDTRLGSVGQHVDQSAKERMLATLDTQIEDWRELNNDPQFVKWLQLPDSYSGAIRHNLLREAFNRNDTGRVAAFFNGFLAEEAATAPQGQPRVQDAPAASNGSRPQQPSKTPLETFASPGRAKSATAPGPAEKPVFTRAQIATFYTAVAAGKYAGREQEKDKLEAQIFSAEREGRIRN